MNRRTFFSTLEAQLGTLSAAQRQDIMADYAQYLDDAISSGRSEADVIAQLGDPQQLARELCAQQHLNTWESHKTPSNFMRVLSSSFRLGAVRFGLSLPFLLGLLGSTVMSIIGYVVLLTSTVGLLIGGSQWLLNWPAPNQFILNDSGIGPWFIMNDSDLNAPNIDITGTDNKAFKIERQADGGVILHARDAQGELTLERNADGSIKQLEVLKGEEHLRINHLQTLPPIGRFWLSLGMLIASIFAIRLAKKWRIQTWAWWRNELNKHITLS